MADESLREDALEYHRHPKPGKIAIVATKPLATQRDLSLAYSPGVAAACLRIVDDPRQAAELTARANLVAVISNGTAVLGLGAIGPLAAKPVMEGKAVLFKTFAGIDSIDIEIDERDPDKLIDIIASLTPSFGAINLEDIKSPECFEVERRLRERVDIPVFHDDQHGTAIIVVAAIRNGLILLDKKAEDVRLVCCGAGAAAIACLDLLVEAGIRKENITVSDVEGVVYVGRTTLMDPYKARYARDTRARTLAEAVDGADVFLGLSAPDVLTADMARSMAERPLILALANPRSEIDPALAHEVRPDAVVATGRSDYPNQVNNVLCFPFIFRGALDCGATQINEAMKLACVDALAALARGEAPSSLAQVYGQESLTFGADYIIPKPFDPRLAVELPIAVARAAEASGVATRPIGDFFAYRQKLQSFVYRSGLAMKPLFDRARADPKRVVYTDGEEPRVLEAVQVAVDEGIVRPILIGRPDVIRRRIERLGLRLRIDEHVELCDPSSDPRYNDYVAHYLRAMGRHGVTPDAAKEVVRTRTSVIAAVMVARGEADALIAGPVGRFHRLTEYVEGVLGRRPDMRACSTLHGLTLERGLLFMADTYVSEDPTSEEVAETALASAEVVRRFNMAPKVALLSHSNFGSASSASALKMREALRLIRARAPELEVDGEMHADAALSEAVRGRILPGSTLRGEANLLIFPTLDSANIAFNLVKAATGAVAIGPILIGPARPAHVVTPSITSRGLVNMTALAVVDAQAVAASAAGPTG